MALNPEEFKRQREMKKQQRADKRRKMTIRLLIAAAVLLVCGLLIFVLLPKFTAPSSDPQVSSDAATEATKETESPFTVVHVAVGGDVNITDKTVAAGGKTYDYKNTFIDVAHILADADLAALNFEGNLFGTPYGTASASAPQQLVEALDSAGVDLIQLANSYSINQGIAGLVSTIDSVRAAGMEPLGVYKDEEDYTAGKGYTIQTVQGIRIAFVAFTKGMDGMALPPGSENCVNLLYEDYSSTYQTINREKITAVLNAAAQERPDVVIAMVHWGSEYNDSVSSSQKSIVSLLQENGVDAVIGTHSHFVQQVEYDQEEGTFVAYSLGDFLSDGERAGTQYSVLLDLEITKNNRNGNVQITGYDLIPIYSYADPTTGNLRVLRIHDAMDAYEDTFIGCVTEEVYDDMIYSLTRIEDRTSGAG